jgi:putative transposase
MRLVRQLPDRHLLSANGRGFHRSLGQSPQGLCWQRGYGAFSVSPSQLDALLGYVETQEEHHRSRTFQEEYREFLRKHGVEYDERYVWD